MPIILGEMMRIEGEFTWVLLDEDENVLDGDTHKNLITTQGDTFYAQRGYKASPPAAPTGMQYGTGTTAVAKTGAGAGIVTYISGSARGFDTGFPVDALVSGAWQVQYQCRWPVGVATNSAVIEFVLINQAVGTDAAAPVANTYSRVKIGSSINKASDKILIGIWNHNFLGA